MRRPDHIEGTGQFEPLDIVELGMAARRQRQGHADHLAAPVAGRPGLGAAVLGLGVSPPLAAALRAVLYILITLGLNAGILYFTQTPPALLALYSALIVGALRQLEGVADGYFKGGGVEQGWSQ
jgi:hypothetical protein